MVDAKIDGDLKADLDKISEEISEGLSRDTLLAAEHVAGEIRREIHARFRGKTGTLGGSFNAVLLKPKGGKIRAGALSDLIYARIQDEGGTIKPKTRQNLSIPLSPEAKTVGKWPRHFARGRLFFMKSKRGNKLLAESVGRGKRARLVLHYLLRPTVQIDGKRYLDAAQKGSREEVAAIFGRRVQASIDRAEGK